MAALSSENLATISPSEITSSSPPPPNSVHTFDSESEFNSPEPEQDGSSKKKRKSWGQPIPQYETILPPGKRAKTEEEKEQRRCERIVRNRKAAATSRDRKKQEFERLEQENKQLREQLAQTQAMIAALQSGQPLPIFPNAEPVPFTSNNNAPLTPAYSAADSPSSSTNNNNTNNNSTARASSPAGSVNSIQSRKNTSPTLAPSLFMKSETSELDNLYNETTPTFGTLADLDSLESLPQAELDDLINSTIKNPQSTLQSFTSIENSGVTQYPAAVLCDLQCQPEASTLESRLNTNNKWINSVLIIQLMVLNVMSNIYSKTMLSTMSQILTSLEQILPRLLSCPKTLDMIFPLIHSLITLPSTEMPSRRAFRMAFLRRLLSCSPASARLFDDATARALQRLSSAEAIQESSQDGLSWASLMTMRWAIKCVERERDIYLKRLKVSPNPVASSSSTTSQDRSSGMVAFEGASLGSFHNPHGRGTCTPGPNVH